MQGTKETDGISLQGETLKKLLLRDILSELGYSFVLLNI